MRVGKSILGAADWRIIPVSNFPEPVAMALSQHPKYPQISPEAWSTDVLISVFSPFQPCPQRPRTNMPPKKANAPSKKNQEKKKAKVVEDKTFGLKNKKGSKQQKFIEQVNKQASAQYGDKNKQKEHKEKKDAKAARQAYLAEMDAILKPIKTERKVIMSKRQEDADKEKKVTYLTIEELVEVERLRRIKSIFALMSSSNLEKQKSAMEFF